MEHIQIGILISLLGVIAFGNLQLVSLLVFN